MKQVKGTKSIHKNSVAFLYTSNEYWNLNLKNNVIYEKKKTLDITLVKYVYDLYTENYKTLMNKIITKWEIVHVHRLKNSILLNPVSHSSLTSSVEPSLINSH